MMESDNIYVFKFFTYETTIFDWWTVEAHISTIWDFSVDKIEDWILLDINGIDNVNIQITIKKIVKNNASCSFYPTPKYLNECVICVLKQTKQFI